MISVMSTIRRNRYSVPAICAEECTFRVNMRKRHERSSLQLSLNGSPAYELVKAFIDFSDRQ